MDTHSPKSGKDFKPRGKGLKAVRFALAAAFALAAIAFFVLSALSCALWKPKNEISASLSSSGKYLASAPGLLSLTGSQVTVEASSSQEVCVAIGQFGDVEGWIGSSPYTEVSGLSSWTELSSAPASGKIRSGASAVPFQDSDMWEKAECGKTMGFSWNPSPDQSLILFNPSGSPAKLSLGWKRAKAFNLAGPYAFLGCVAALLAAVALAFPALLRKALPKKPAEGDAFEEFSKEGERPRWALDQIASDRRARRAGPRTVKSTKVFKIREKSEEDEVSTQVMDLSALRHMDSSPFDPMAQKPSLFGSEPPSFPAAFSAFAAGTAFSVASEKESDPGSKNRGPAIVDKRSVNLLSGSGSSKPARLHPESGDLGAYFKRLREEKREEGGKREKKA